MEGRKKEALDFSTFHDTLSLLFAQGDHIFILYCVYELSNRL